MIDIHCHILPGIDDGAKTIEDSLEMAKVAVDEGIKTIIATPHHKNNQFNNRKEDILQHVEYLNKVYKQNSVPITILPGQEVRIFGEVLEEYKKGEILTLNHTKYLFIEFPSSSVPRYAERLLYDILTQGIIPVIVHPERNKELQEKTDILYKLVQNGALTQVTGASVCGYFGKRIKEFSEQLIEANLTHFIASDAHNTTTRTFKMSQAYDEIEKKFGLDYVYLFLDNAELLIEDKNINKIMPQPFRKKKKFLGIF
ncbi:CpsB/CapC family capsule biosynthesis tyrosine phosphatase [Niallia sp. Man26]|uniref:tyrosine-protein phosphatase n=1 Tax=Niallia sp. Man26 TaxID=2912824 RepID=UPI001EDA6341|nr:CpsB/CapC family capsule biosynthesis tyrosine phosphatase [Niallia sp. Man26]UPO87344.1 tyrosine protein phosphatase [Niallia sp. Man26]